MRICFLAPADNAHTKKWCRYFLSKGHEIHVISFIDDDIDGVVVHYVDSGALKNDSQIKKIKYFFQVYRVRHLIKLIQPDVVNAHYATSYGIVAACAGIGNYVLSVWGSDIYFAPRKSIFHKLMIKFSLLRATYLFSTSRAMAGEMRKYTKKPVVVTPFGVDVEMFSPIKRNRDENTADFIVGTVKTLSQVYGIEYILKAVKIVTEEHPEIPIKLRIAGKGESEKEYKELASELGIDDITTWLGFISQEEAAKEWANMDIAIIPSVSESFGVSAVEAQACACPVIISDAPGLLEATIPGETSCLVPRRDAKKIADLIAELYDNSDKRIAMGKKGRDFVKSEYQLDVCFRKIEKQFYEYFGQ